MKSISSESHGPDYVTYYDTKEWITTLINRQGWMVIAHAQGNQGNQGNQGKKLLLKEYKQAIAKARIFLKACITSTKEKTLKMEYKELLSNIQILERHVKKEFSMKHKE
jgi:hypothetical protein